MYNDQSSDPTTALKAAKDSKERRQTARKSMSPWDMIPYVAELRVSLVHSGLTGRCHVLPMFGRLADVSLSAPALDSIVWRHKRLAMIAG